MDFEQVVPLNQIESSLEKILDDLQGKNKTRACLFNLCIYTKENTREKYIQSVMQKIVERFPCRIILFIDKGKAEFALRSTISVIEIKQGGAQVFCDCIQFELSEDHLKQIRFLTLPHLMTDLPTYFLWAEDPIKQDPTSFHFESFCSRIIFDSEAADNLISFAKNALKYQFKSGLHIADLNWARTESFRDLFTSLFFLHKNVNKLATIKHLKITYNQTPSSYFCHTKIQATYFSIWLAGQLNYTFQSAKEDEITFKNHQTSMTCTLVPQENSQVTSGRILSIEIELENEHFLMKRKEKDPKVITIYRTVKDFCEIPSEFLLDAEDSGASLVGEIFHQGTSTKFIEVLHFIAHQPIENFCS
jgi:glucose-6-phosphate dehydrogenase assembly protein OpcA